MTTATYSQPYPHNVAWNSLVHHALLNFREIQKVKENFSTVYKFSLPWTLQQCNYARNLYQYLYIQPNIFNITSLFSTPPPPFTRKRNNK